MNICVYAKQGCLRNKKFHFSEIELRWDSGLCDNGFYCLCKSRCVTSKQSCPTEELSIGAQHLLCWRLSVRQTATFRLSNCAAASFSHISNTYMYYSMYIYSIPPPFFARICRVHLIIRPRNACQTATLIYFRHSLPKMGLPHSLLHFACCVVWRIVTITLYGIIIYIFPLSSRVSHMRRCVASLSTTKHTHTGRRDNRERRNPFFWCSCSISLQDCRHALQTILCARPLSIQHTTSKNTESVTRTEKIVLHIGCRYNICCPPMSGCCLCGDVWFRNIESVPLSVPQSCSNIHHIWTVHRMHMHRLPKPLADCGYCSIVSGRQAKTIRIIINEDFFLAASARTKALTRLTFGQACMSLRNRKLVLVSI